MTKLSAQTQAEFCSTLVDEWVRAGVASAVVSPGSRSAPMALALVADGRLDVRVRLDERSAGFVALGIGLARGLPAVVLTTSGTAAAELHPAVVEADLARVPLIVCTADRPPELRAVGAPQTIEQRGLYGASVRWSLDAGVPDERERHTWRSLGSRIVAEAVAGPAGPGPVHVNLTFCEPLVAPAGTPIDLPPARSGSRGWHGVARGRRVPAASQVEELGPLIVAGRRGVILAGARCGDPDAVLALSAMLGWPVVADARSGCRRVVAAGPAGPPGEETVAGPVATGTGPPGGGPVAGPVVIAAADALLRDPRFLTEHSPDVVLRLGELWASKVLAQWLAGTAASGAVHVIADPDWAWRDPGREAAVHLSCDPDELIAALLAGEKAPATSPSTSAVGALPEPRDLASPSADAGRAGRCSSQATEWARSWAEGEEAAQLAIEAVLDRGDELTEPFIARHVYGCAGVATIVVASSMPCRDLEWFARPAAKPPRVLSNRGANGIDGVASTTLGVAIAGPVASAPADAGTPAFAPADAGPVASAPADAGTPASAPADAGPVASAPADAGTPASAPAGPAAGRPAPGGGTAGVTVGILGDLAFLHDLTALVGPAGGEAFPPCVFVVVDNSGGGIFSFLPQATELEEERFERLFGTPQRPDVAVAARGLGARVTEARTRSGFEKVFAQALAQVAGAGTDGLQDPVVVVARTDRRRNVEVHAELNAAVSAALEDLSRR